MRLYKRKKTWWIRYKLHGMDVRKSLHTHSRATAEGVMSSLMIARTGRVPRPAIDAMLDQIYGTAHAEEARVKLADAWDLYWETAKSLGLDAVGADTVRKRKAHLRNLTDWIARELPAVTTADAVDGPIAARYAAHLATKGLCGKTRAMTLADLAHVFRTLGKSDARIANPFDGLRPRATDSTVRLAFTPDEERRILDAADRLGHGWRLACLVSRHTGLRYGDVATLRRDEIDLAAGVIRRIPNKTAAHHVAVTIPIETRELGPALAAALAETPVDDDLGVYLLREHAHYYMLSGHSKMPVQFSDVLKAAEVDTATHTFHSWRHTINTRMSAAGVDMATRKEISGHMTDQMSMHYDHDEHLEAKRAAIEAAAK